MTLDDLDDAGLIAALATRPEAFAVLYRRHERTLLGFLIRRTRRPELAADLAAESFAAALEALRREAGPDGPFGPWLFGIARHKLADSRRAGTVEDVARRRLAMEPVVLTDDALQAIDALDDDTRIAELVDALPEPQRDAVIARIVDEREYSDIAAAIACSEMVVRKRVSRGLATLRARIDGGLS